MRGLSVTVPSSMAATDFFNTIRQRRKLRGADNQTFESGGAESGERPLPTSASERSAVERPAVPQAPEGFDSSEERSDRTEHDRRLPSFLSDSTIQRGKIGMKGQGSP